MLLFYYVLLLGGLYILHFLNLYMLTGWTLVLLQFFLVVKNWSITFHKFFLCSFAFLFVPWYFLEQPGMEVSQIQFNFWIFFSNAICALALNFSIFLVIGRTGAVTIRVAGVLKDWILIALSTVIFPESIITGLNITGYAIGISSIHWKCWKFSA